MLRLSKVVLIAVLCVGSFAHAQSNEQADKVRAIYQQKYASKLVPLLTEVLKFPTVQGNETARINQKKWIQRVGAELGLEVRDAGLVTEVELPGPQGAPVLGLVVHGDVQPVNEAEWHFPPFAGVEKDGVVYGRGAADDKGPLVQALLAMASLRDSGIQRTHTVRLLVGSDEESTNLDITSYLKTHAAPNLSLVIDSGFPVIVGEKAWSAFTVTATHSYEVSGNDAGKFVLTKLDAGLAASIVPSQAVAHLRWTGDPKGLEKALASIRQFPAPAPYKLKVDQTADGIVVSAGGHAAHAGVNLEGGRNALVFLAKALHGKLQSSPAADLLLFAEQAGKDIYGSGLGLTTNDKLWGHNAVNVATIEPEEKDPTALTLTINIRALPTLWGEPLQKFLNQRLAAFNTAHGRNFTSGGFFADPPLAFDPNSKIVKRLLADYASATGKPAAPAISGGGTYAKRLPNAIAFGMWFPDKPYPGHDVDEKITTDDLHKGVRVLIEAITDIGTSAPIVDPFKP